MKKIIGVLLILIMALSFAACSTTPSQGGNGGGGSNGSIGGGSNSGENGSTLPPEVEPAESKILIAYFTWAENTVVVNPDSVNVDASTSASLITGNTAIMAGYIEQVTGGELFSITVTNPYPSDYDECLNRANREKAQNARPELKNAVENMDEYDIVFLGYPNWWYTIPMAVHTFLESYDFGGKTVIPFCTHGTGGLASTVRDIRSAIPQATVLDAIGISRSDMSSAESRINTWLNNLGFEKE
jgi:flavodoxin